MKTDSMYLPPQAELFTQEETGGISLEEVFEAYFACRRKKRGTYNALAFEADYERKCIDLWREINSGTYHPSRSVAFMPVYVSGHLEKVVLKKRYAARTRLQREMRREITDCRLVKKEAMNFLSEVQNGLRNKA